MQQIQ